MKTSIDRLEIQMLRDEMITLRDEALKQNDFTWAVTLSHVVMALYEFKRIVEELELDKLEPIAKHNNPRIDDFMEGPSDE